VGEVLAPALHLPDWVNSALAFFIILGFPLAVIFAWAFEVTPEGLKLEKNVDRTQSITHQTGQKLNITIIALLALALAYFALDKFVLDPGRDAANIEAAVQSAQEETQAGTISVQTEAKPSDHSIAVLPFINMSDDAGNEYFSDGLSEELLNLLAKIPQLRVAARTSSFQFKGRTGDIADIAAQLKVAHVLEGSVRKAGDQVRVTAQLIKAEDGYHLWSETYDRTLDNIFKIQDEIAAHVVEALKVTLLNEAPLVKEADPEAYALYLQGRHFLLLAGEENWARAAQAYRQALDLDPDYATAWAGLSHVLSGQSGQGFIDFESGIASARSAALHSIELDPELALGWAALSRVQSTFDFDWNAAWESMQTALRLAPNDVSVVARAAQMSAILGQWERSLEYYKQAVDADPLNTSAIRNLASAYEQLGLLDEAEAVIRHQIVLNPDQGWINLAWILIQKGEPEQALIEAENSTGQDGWKALVRAMALHTLGRHDEAAAEARSFEAHYKEFWSYQLAEIHAWQGSPDAAFEALEYAYSKRDPGLSSLLNDNAIRSLYNDARWEPFLEKIGLLEAWRAMPDEYKEPIR